MLKRKYLQNPVIQTFIDQRLQDFTENMIQNEVRIFRGMGIGNAAIVIIDNYTHSLVTYSGSAGINENHYKGQVDGISALHSPGSALKPFLYALAMDR